MDREFIWKVAGGDPVILQGCDLKIRKIFTLIGWCVVVISGVCMVSAFYSVWMVFGNIVVAIPLAIFFSWVIINIYRLNLITLNKTLLPHKPSRATTVSATILRITFMCLIAYLISKPLGVIIYQQQISAVLQQENASLLNDFTQQVTKDYEKERSLLILELNKLQAQSVVDGLQIGFISQRKAFLEEQLSRKEEQYQLAILKAKKLFRSSDFFIRRIQIMNARIFGGDIISLLCIALFIVPVIVKKGLEASSSYYVRKSVVEREIILGAYKEFKKVYIDLMKDVAKKEIAFTENYQDAPFNTVKMPDRRRYQKYGTLFDSL